MENRVRSPRDYVGDQYGSGLMNLHWAIENAQWDELRSATKSQQKLTRNEGHCLNFRITRVDCGDPIQASGETMSVSLLELTTDYGRDVNSTLTRGRLEKFGREAQKGIDSCSKTNLKEVVRDDVSIP